MNLRTCVGPLVLLAFGLVPTLAMAMQDGFRYTPNHGPSASAPVPVTVVQQHASSTQLLSSSVNPVPIGQPVTLTAHFPALPDGTKVNFLDGSSLLSSSTLKASVASVSLNFASTGAHSLSAVTVSSAAVKTSSSVALAQQVLPATTAMSLSNASTASVVGQAVKLNAAVSGASPTGVVTFSEGSTTLGSASLASGVAALSYTFASSGTHTIQARYPGDSRNTAASSPLLNVAVAPASSATVLSAAANPVVAGTTLNLTARISGTGATTGTVTFLDGTTVLGSVALVGSSASFGTSFAISGSHSLSASYSGNSAATASKSAALAEVVSPGSTATTLASSVNPIGVGRAVLLTARVSGGASSGTVLFRDGTATLGSGTLSNGVATFSATFSSVGSHALSASFGGSASLAASQSGNLAESVTTNVSASTLAVSPSPATVGQAVRLSAAVSGFNPSGSVTFKDGSTVLGAAPLSGGAAALSTTFSVVGSHSITMSYAGDSANAASASAAQTLAVNAASSQTVLSASSSAPALSQSIVLSAKVSGFNPTGTVTFRTGTSTLGSSALSAGTATLPVAFATAGTYNVTATYAGNSSNLTSSSSVLPITVGSTSAGKPPATGNGIDYLGGPVMSSGVNLYFIWYGNWVGSTAPTVINNFANGIGGSPWYHINTTYSDKSNQAVSDKVTLLASTSDNYSQGKTLSDNTVFTVVSSAINGGRLPLDPNGFYVVFTSADVGESSGFCTNYCGWHTSGTLNGTNIKFSFIGSTDRCASACSTGTKPPNGSVAGDGMASVFAHELSETVSDPDLNAWYQQSTGQENGDLCAWNFGTTSTTSTGEIYNVTLPTGKFLIQQMWHNAPGGRCALSYP